MKLILPQWIEVTAVKTTKMWQTQQNDMKLSGTQALGMAFFGWSFLSCLEMANLALVS